MWQPSVKLFLSAIVVVVYKVVTSTHLRLYGQSWILSALLSVDEVTIDKLLKLSKLLFFRITMEITVPTLSKR